MQATSEEEVILSKIREIIEHGFGKVEVLIQDQKISNLKWEKSVVNKDLLLELNRDKVD